MARKKFKYTVPVSGVYKVSHGIHSVHVKMTGGGGGGGGSGIIIVDELLGFHPFVGHRTDNKEYSQGMFMGIFLNNNVGNVILEEGAIYETIFPAEGRWPELKTILKFNKQVHNGYWFDVLEKNHQNMIAEAHGRGYGYIDITYTRDQLRSATFKRSQALDVLYGSTKV